MVSQLEHDYAQLCSNAWALLSPRLCPCGGSGWLMSDLDTEHRCPIHGAGAPDPDRYEGDDDEEGEREEARRYECARQIYKRLATHALSLGFKSPVAVNHAAFEAADKMGLLREDVDKASALIEGLEAVIAEHGRQREDRVARRQGYSCGLEMRFAEYAAMEAHYGGEF